MKRSRRGVGSMTTLVVAATLAAGCTTGTSGTSGPAETSGTSGASATAAAQATSPSAACPVRESSDGAQIEVSESAVTTAEDSLGDTMASYAVVLTNPSADLAVASDLEIRLLDNTGEPVEGLDDGRSTFFASTVAIPPGQQRAVTDRIYVDGTTVASIEVSVKATLWLDGADDRVQPVTVTDVAAQPEGGGALIEFEARSSHADVLNPVAAYAVFRDDTGNLLGGSSHIDAEPREYQPGENHGEIETPTVPEGWDPETTEVHVSSNHHLSMVACR